MEDIRVELSIKELELKRWKLSKIYTIISSLPFAVLRKKKRLEEYKKLDLELTTSIISLGGVPVDIILPE